MPYAATVKKLIDGQYYARCPTAPNGLTSAQGQTAEEALENLREEIRYQLEFCPCSAVAEDYVKLEVTHLPSSP